MSTVQLLALWNLKGSLILHVLLKDGESTMNGGFTNNSKTAFKVDSPDENRQIPFYSQLMH